MFFCLCVDPAGAAGSNTIAGWPDPSAPGPAGSAPADYHPTAPDSHHSWTEPGVKL